MFRHDGFLKSLFRRPASPARPQKVLEASHALNVPDTLNSTVPPYREPKHKRNHRLAYGERLSGSELRLVQLVGGLSGDDDTPSFECALDVFEFRPGHDASDHSTPSPTPAYIALSYVWREAPGHVSVLCNNQLVVVTKNLARALRQVWLEQPYALIWADALCINQADDEEKSIQVGLMGSIFAQAASVHIWLGNFYEKPHVLSELSEACDEISNTQKELSALLVGSQSAHTALFEKQRQHIVQLRENMRKLRLQQWYYRSWTFQERTLARKVIVRHGRDHLGLPRFQQMLELLIYVCEDICDSTQLVDSKGEDPAPSSTDGEMAQVWGYALLLRYAFAPKTRRDLAALLIGAWHLQVSDNHDKVYSVLSLWTASRANVAFHPDYSLSIPDAFKAATRWAIQADKSLDVLRLAVHCRMGTHMVRLLDDAVRAEMPSWVPDLRTTTVVPIIQQTPEHVARRSDGQGVQDFEPPGSLHLEGVVLGTLGIPESNTATVRRRLDGFPDCVRDWVKARSHETESTSGYHTNITACVAALETHREERCTCNADATPVSQTIASSMHVRVVDEVENDWLVWCSGSSSLFILRPLPVSADETGQLGDGKQWHFRLVGDMDPLSDELHFKRVGKGVETKCYLDTYTEMLLELDDTGGSDFDEARRTRGEVKFFEQFTGFWAAFDVV